MATLRNRFFMEGVLLGGLCGVALGSLLALQVRQNHIQAARKTYEKVVLRREPGLNMVTLGQ